MDNKMNALKPDGQRAGRRVMKKIMLLIQLLLVVNAGCDSRSVKTAEVRVLDNKFRVIKTVKDPGELKRLTDLWESRREAPRGTRAKFSHKFDIVSEEGMSARWLYDKSGYALRLTKMKTPLYEITDREEFNRLLMP